MKVENDSVFSHQRGARQCFVVFPLKRTHKKVVFYLKGSYEYRYQGQYL